MPSPFKTLTSLVAIGLGVALLTGPANAVPPTTAPGLTSPGFQVHDAGYSNRGKRRSLYVAIMRRIMPAGPIAPCLMAGATRSANCSGFTPRPCGRRACATSLILSGILTFN
jgi:hypothetical protein